MIAFASVPANSPETSLQLERVLEYADLGLMAVGLVATSVILGRLLSRVRRGRVLLHPAHNRLTIECVLLPMFAWIMIGSLGSAIVTSSFPDADQQTIMIYVGNAAHLLAGVVCVVVGHFTFRGGWRRFLAGRVNPGRDVVAGVAAMFMSFPLCFGVLVCTEAVLRVVSPEYEFSEHDVVETLRSGDLPLWTLWIGTTLIAPFGEEVFFRGICQPFLMRLSGNRWFGIGLTAVAFGLVHLGGEVPQWHVVPALTVLGLILGILYARTRSLIGPIVLHALFNAKTLLWESLRAAT